MLLSELMSVIDYNEVINRTGIETAQTQVASLCFDSRKASANSMFVCPCALRYARSCGACLRGHQLHNIP